MDGSARKFQTLKLLLFGTLDCLYSAVARGGAGGIHAPPPQFFTKKVKKDLYKIFKQNIIKQLFGKFSKNDLLMKSMFVSKATQTVNNYELTMMTLKGETFAAFKIQR